MIRMMVAGGVAVLLSISAGCVAKEYSGEKSSLGLFSRIALLFERYNGALALQDEAGLAAVGAEIARLVDERFDEVAEGLVGKDTRIQCDAAFALGFSRRRESVALLVQATRSPLIALRANAAAALGMLGREDVPEAPFVDLLQDPEAKVRQAALVGLRFLLAEGRDRGFLGKIHEKLSDPSMEVRNEALITLRRMGRKESVQAILERSVKDPEPLVRANAAAALGVMGTKAFEATAVLIEMLRDDEPKVVESAWVALRAIHRKELDRSYGSWRGWYEEESQHVYVCTEHREVSNPFPGACPRCGSAMERIPLELVRRQPVPAGSFACPDHPEVVTATAGRCGKCGKDLVLRRETPVRYECPSHPEVQTLTSGRCGKCGKDLVPKN